MAEIHPTAIVYPGTVLGEGVQVLEHAVVGKQPTLSPRSPAKREPLPPAEVGDGTIVSTGAVVFAGSSKIKDTGSPLDVEPVVAVEYEVGDICNLVLLRSGFG